MAIVELKVPSPGESITEVVIARWVKNTGDVVDKDEVLAEIDSDKATLTLNAEDEHLAFSETFLVVLPELLPVFKPLVRAGFAGLTLLEPEQLRNSAATWLQPLLRCRRDLELSATEFGAALLNLLTWEERQRLDLELKNRGYYYFGPDYLIFRVDSTVGNRQLDVLLRVKEEAPAEEPVAEEVPAEETEE